MLRSFFHFIQNALSPLRPFWSVLLIVGIIIGLLFVILLILMAYFSARNKKSAAAEFLTKAPAQEENKSFQLPPFLLGLSEFFTNYKWFQAGDFSQSFFQVHEYLRRTIPGVNYKYHLPWFLMMGPEKSGKTTLLKGLEDSMGCAIPDFDQPLPRTYCRWSFFNDAVVLNLKGDFLLKERGAESESAGFQTLIALLSRYRMRRPLNGIILTLSVEDLYGKDGMEADEITQRARLMHAQINTAQNFLSMRLPIYLYITKIDKLPGFQEFVHKVPQAFLNQPIGWSNPHNLDHYYTSHWMDEAFDTFGADLNRLGMEFLSEADSFASASGIFIFTQELLSLKEKLGLYLNGIFKTNQYEQAPVFRGLYFTGEGYFAQDILTHKIIKEEGIAAPLAHHFYASEKATRTLKYATAIFSVVAICGFLNARGKFHKQHEELLPILYNMSSLFDRMQALPINDNQKMRAIFDQSTQQLIVLSDQSARSAFFSVFIPASWFSEFRKDLHRTINRTSQLIILRSLYYDLILKTRDILHTRPLPHNYSKSLGELILPFQCREFKVLQTYVERISELYIHAQKFNTMIQHPTAQDLDDLMHYTFQSRLPQQFIDRYHKIDAYLKNDLFPAIDLMPYETEARKTLSILYQFYFNALFDVNTPGSLAHRIAQFMTELNPKNPQTHPDICALKQASLSLTAVMERFGAEGQTWLDQPYMGGKEFEGLLARMDHFPLFGKAVTRYLVDQTAFGFDKFKHLIRQFNSFMDSRIVETDKACDKKSLPLSSGMLKLEKALQSIFSQPYVFTEKADMFKTNLPQEQVSFWDISSIKAISRDIAAHKKYLSKELPTMPIVLHDKVQMILQEGLSNFIQHALAQAQVVEKRGVHASEAVLRNQVQAIQSLAKDFGEILDFLEHSQAGDVYVGFRQLLRDQAMHLLGQVDAMFEASEIYKVRDDSFHWWDGKAGVGFEAFGVKDSAEFKHLVSTQFNQLKLMQKFAQPLVDFLTAKNMVADDDRLVYKWQGMLQQIGDKDKGKPSGSMAVLEAFLSGKINEINMNNAFKKINMHEILTPSGDIFLERLRLIKKQLLERAEVLLRARAMQNYQELFDFFTKYIKGNFPFANAKTRGKINEVQPQALKEFLLLYDKLGGTPEKIADQMYQLGIVADENMQWLQRVYGVRLFFDAWMRGLTETPVPEFDIMIEFRVNRTHGANDQFISDLWVKPNEGLEINNAQQKKRLGRWSYGQPIEIGFRWAQAEDIPQPLADPLQPELHVSNTEAIFSYSGNWSLLWLLQSHGADHPEYATPNDTAPLMMRFEIPQTGMGKAVVFHRIQVIKPAKSQKEPSLQTMAIPDFPFDVPPLSPALEEYAQQPYLVDQESAAEEHPVTQPAELMPIEQAPEAQPPQTEVTQ